VPILTSTVVECQRAGFKKAAFEHATVLMNPDYRKDIKPALLKNIERLVRHPEKGDDEAEDMAPCPHCQLALPVMQLDCPRCKNALPSCIATGEHIVADDLAVCPACAFPARHSAFVAQVEQTGACPMCDAPLVSSAIARCHDAASVLRRAAPTQSVAAGAAPSATGAAAGAAAVVPA
jgi:WD repeat-containing protein 19